MFNEDDINGPAGLAFLWTGFGICFTVASVFILLAVKIGTSRTREICILYGAGCLIQSLTYFALADGHGISKNFYGRHIAWLRYASWAIFVPFLIYRINFLDIATKHKKLVLLITSEAVIIFSFLSTQADTRRTTWLFYSASCFLSVVTCYYTLFEIKPTIPQSHRGVHTLMSIFLVATWAVFLLGQGMTDSGHVIPEGYTNLWFLVVDIVTKGVFGFITFAVMRSVDAKFPRVAASAPAATKYSKADKAN
ncbi:opsin [Planoprotostelium fungivorum]|uniref:Opsin n=1 Tax=Planoprotostelium fungivorum TaxID=1890364 RepID=A0A2P6P0M2_9EUKA|nr:opsin [Planoprotostelium fungivorum]